MGCINGETHVETPKESPTRQPAESSVLVGKGKSVIRRKLCLWTKELGHTRIHGDHSRFDASAAAKMTKAKRISWARRKPIYLRLVRLQTAEHFGIFVILDEGFCLGHRSNKSRSNKLVAMTRSMAITAKVALEGRLVKRRPVPSAHR